MATPTLLASFALAVVSAIVPWVNGELILLAFTAPATAATDLAAVVVAVTAGQVTGKSALYWLARRAQRLPPRRVDAAIDRWREQAARRPLAGLATMFASATFGVPPLYITTLAAGSLMVEFGSFLAIIVVGRLLHFGAIALTPRFVGHLLQ
jgi:membrane protein YqaA with SNARE-associated domain